MSGSQQAGDDLLKELAMARAGLCKLLARVFSARPTAELVAGIKDGPMLAALASLGVEFEEDFITGDDGEQAEGLAVEYTRLFVGPGPHIAPYESVFVGGEGDDGPRLWGSTTVAVSEFYREAGLEMKHDDEMPDHIGIEFEVMAELAAAEAGERDGDEKSAQRLWELQQRFAREHLALWLPAFRREVERQARLSFYRGMAELAASLVQIYED